ncbi:MAG: DUF47 family protein [Spirochaetes bacterium]|uniref:DUF47 family protein n=1 Tax=Candidatus Ornithospirochaeta stercoripullorum TaxID=2840899 RepID=A0A9D9E1W2_9SPIO|nr:DUF47 family protein [Candidatus Ornithospirochaeta stercoripullorum]
MGKKADTFYFDTFRKVAEHAITAAKILTRCISSYDPDNLSPILAEIHKTEHDADMLKHEMMNVLAKAFITPIERDDIILLSQCLDEVVDKIEDVVLRLYCDNIHEIKPQMLEGAAVVEKCCEEMQLLMDDFSDFRHSKTLKERIITINTMEEEADRIFIENMRALHTTSSSALDVIVWRDIYRYLEECTDACEHVADAVEKAVMNNT